MFRCIFPSPRLARRNCLSNSKAPATQVVHSLSNPNSHHLYKTSFVSELQSHKDYYNFPKRTRATCMWILNGKILSRQAVMRCNPVSVHLGRSLNDSERPLHKSHYRLTMCHSSKNNHRFCDRPWRWQAWSRCNPTSCLQGRKQSEKRSHFHKHLSMPPRQLPSTHTLTCPSRT